MGISREEIEAIIALPARTLTRRKQARRLQSMESDRLLRLARVAAHAVVTRGPRKKLRSGCIDLTVDWEEKLHCNSSIRTSTAQIDDVLTRLDHGVVG